MFTQINGYLNRVGYLHLHIYIYTYILRGYADHPEDEFSHHTITNTDDWFDLWRIFIRRYPYIYISSYIYLRNIIGNYSLMHTVWLGLIVWSFLYLSLGCGWLISISVDKLFGEECRVKLAVASQQTKLTSVMCGEQLWLYLDFAPSYLDASVMRYLPLDRWANR